MAFLLKANKNLLNQVIFCLIGLIINSLPEGASQLKPWPSFWEVKINLFIKGNYLLFDQNRSLEGCYHGQFRWQGLLEPDEPDLILYHWQTEVLSWEVLEKEKKGDKETAFSRSSNPPRLKVGTFLREDEAFWLDFFLEDPSDSFSPSQIKRKLILPASFIRNLIVNGLRYNDFLKGGSNKIFVPIKEMAKPEFHQNFSWKWSYPPSYPKLHLNEFGEEHEVNVTVQIKSHYKKTPLFKPGDENGHKLPVAIGGLNGYRSG